MKTVYVSLLAVFPVFAALAQPSLVPSSPALSPSSTVPVSTPALGFPTATSPGTNVGAAVGGSVSNATVKDVAGAIANLQAAVQQALPLVQATANTVDGFGNTQTSTNNALAASNLPSLSSVTAMPSTDNFSMRQTVRAMEILQSDLERSLPIISALSGVNLTNQLLTSGVNQVQVPVQASALTNVFNQ